ncbi:zinc ribbon domain-containing protein [Natrialbaceae archaeon GCM10025810]|uniref:zinc ribbon domain-containing protein n=1 Tax=Halovalidus salilacus TaxID=3075124 RepID=UPI00360795EF
MQEYTEYNLEEYGIECRWVDPRNTSRACSRTDCDCVSDANREGKSFRCGDCGYEVNADYFSVLNAFASEELDLSVDSALYPSRTGIFPIPNHDSNLEGGLAIRIDKKYLKTHFMMEIGV